MLFPLELIYLALPPSFVLFHLSDDQIPVPGIFPSSASIAVGAGGFKSQLIDIPSHSLPSLSNSFVLLCHKFPGFHARRYLALASAITDGSGRPAYSSFIGLSLPLSLMSLLILLFLISE